MEQGKSWRIPTGISKTYLLLFVSYELYEESKINLKKTKYYKNLKTGAIITEKEFKNLVTDEESRFYNLSGNICPGFMDHIIENESIESIENYVPVDLPK